MTKFEQADLGYSVKEAVDRYIISQNEDREPDGMYHPSSMMQCARKVIYQLRGTETSESTEPEALRRFWIGHRLHDAVQGALAVDPRVEAFYPEVEVNVPGLNVTGHGDGLLKIRFPDGTTKWVLLEIKSIRKSGFRYGLKEDNVNQGLVYGHAIREYGCLAYSLVTGLMVPIQPLGDELAGLLVVYLEKEDLEIREHFIPWKAEYDQKVIDRVAYLDQYRNDEAALPPRIPKDKNGKKNWQCRFCPFQTKCWTKDPDEVKPKEAIG